MNSDFNEFIRLAKKIVPRKATLDLLRYACITNSSIRVTDLDHILIYHLPEGVARGDFLLPFDLLERIAKLKKLTCHPFLLENNRIEAGGRLLTLDSLSLPEIGEYPLLPHPDFKTIDKWQPVFIKQLKTHKSYRGADPLRPALHCIQIKCSEDVLITAATDGHRLIYMKHLDQHPAEEYQLLLPPIALEILEGTSEEIRISLGVQAGMEHTTETPPIYARFEWGNFCLISRLAEDPYPEVECVIDSSVKGAITFERKTMLALLEEALTLLTGKHIAINLDVGGDMFELTVFPNSFESAGESFALKEQCEGIHHGSVFSIAFDARYLWDVLWSFASVEYVTLGYTRWDRASYITISPKEHTETEILLMPLREITGVEPRYPHLKADEIAV